MGRLGIFDDERKRWIQFDEDTEVLVKLVTKEELRKIQQKADKTARLARVNPADIADQKLGKAAVHGWRKIADHEHPGLVINDEPFPFSPENTGFLMKRSIAFSRFVNDNSIDEQAFLESEEDSKNA